MDAGFHVLLLARSLGRRKTQGRFPGFRVIASPSAFPGSSPSGWRPSAFEDGLTGYSGGTAQDSDLLPS
jgi:hypothetical protein